MPVDKIDMQVFGKYYDPNTPQTNQTAWDNLVGFITQVTNAAQTVVVDGVGYTSGSLRLPPATGVLTDPNESAAYPKAHLNWATFDRDWKFLDGGSKQLQGGAEDGTDVPFAEISKSIEIKEPGYVYIWLSNTSAQPRDVFFDDFKVVHTKSPVVQQEEYYPFGLAFNGYKKENSIKNKYLFNGGSEIQTELDLGWYSTIFRIYDPNIGRFLQVDPMADFFSGINPYNFAENNPILYGDPSGLSPTLWERIKAFFGIGRMSGTRAAGNKKYVKPVARSKGDPVPYNFHLPPSDPVRPPAPVSSVQSTVDEEPEAEQPITYIPPPPPQATTPKPKPKPKTRPTTPPPPSPSPKGNQVPFEVGPKGLTFNDYEFQSGKSDIYHTPQNDKLIKDLVTTLKSSASIHLEIRGNVDHDRSNSFDNFFSGVNERIDILMSARSKAIYDALIGAGVPESQLKTAPGIAKGTTAGAHNMKTTFILTNH